MDNHISEIYQRLIESFIKTGCMIIYWDGMPFASKVTYVSSNITSLEFTTQECKQEGFLGNHLIDSNYDVCGLNRQMLISGETNEYDIEYLYHTYTGREIWLSERTSVIYVEGQIAYGETIIRDISEMKLQEHLLDEYGKDVRDKDTKSLSEYGLAGLKFELRNIMSLKELQAYQDIFCKAQSIYGVCYDSNGNRLTKLSIGKEDRAMLMNSIGRIKTYHNFDDIARAVIMSSDIVKMESDIEGVKMIGLPIKYDNDIKGVWAIAYVGSSCAALGLASKLSRKLHGNYIDEIVSLLDALSCKFVSASYSTAIALKEAQRNDTAKQNMEKEYRRNAALTSIVQLLEEDQNFEDAVKIALNIVGDFLKIDGAVLVKTNDKNDKYSLVAEWTKEGVKPFSKRILGEHMELPKFEDCLVVLSSNDDKGIYADILRFYECNAVVVIPIMLNGKTAMYLAFVDFSQNREWDGSTVRFLSDVSKMIQSILYKRITKNSLVSSYTALKEILDNIGSEICVIDKQSKEILFCNDIVKKVCKTDMVGKKCCEYNTACNLGKCETCPAFYDNSYFEETYSSARGAWYEIKYNDITWVDGRTVSLCNVTDVTEKKKYQKRIEFQANNDFLTGLYNRMRCEEDLELSIRESITYNSKGALLFMDLDNFKHINDGLGHQYGDVLLKTISVGIQQIHGIEDRCYRVGGDEFIIIVEPGKFSELSRILDDLKRMFSKPWYLNQNEYYCTMSMGIVQFPDDGRDVNSLIRKADIAMYDAKKSGKNRYEYYNHGEDISMVEKLDIEKNMRSAVAIGCNEFEIYVQPIVDASTEMCIGGEALLRWNSGRLGMLTPGEFIPLADHLGLITPIGEYVLRQACMSNKHWSDLGIDMHINVNLSVVQLLQNNVLETIKSAIEISGVKPENLVLEVTESLAINDMNRMKKIIKEIKGLGVKIALDDFGTGYSSLNYIKQMDLDIIKVDRTFIKDIMEDDYAQAFVKLISDLSKKLDVKVCVEGVEEREQLDILKDMDVSMIQGFYFGKPMPLHDFEEKYVMRAER